MSAARTPESLREDFMGSCREIARYWAGPLVEEHSVEERLSGMLHSILPLIDGQAGMPALDLVCRPHPDDKEFHQAEGEDWVEDGTVLNADVLLHELLYRRDGS